jgi:hypothetical protein
MLVFGEPDEARGRRNPATPGDLGHTSSRCRTLLNLSKSRVEFEGAIPLFTGTTSSSSLHFTGLSQPSDRNLNEQERS